MDGSIADLYGVNGWLDDLVAHNTRPYEKAEIMYKPLELLRVLAELKFRGYKIGVISWCSKEKNANFDVKIRQAKKEWLKKYMLDILLDEVIITAYGVNKADTCRKFGKGILIDDEEPNRNSWNLGETINANEDIIKALWELVK